MIITQHLTIQQKPKEILQPQEGEGFKNHKLEGSKITLSRGVALGGVKSTDHPKEEYIWEILKNMNI